MIFILLFSLILFDKLSANQQIIQLSSLNLTEEFNYSNYFLINLTNQRLQLLNYRGYFYLNKSTLYTNGTFDRESLCNSEECSITIKIASYDEKNNLEKIFNLPIFIQDVNDCRPEFKNQFYQVNISENLSSRTVLPLEPPSDLDSSRYSIQNCSISNNSNLFDISFNKQHKSLYLIVNSPLDRENRSNYKLSLVCSDGTAEASTELIINVLDANDNIPYFKQDKFNISIEENRIFENLLQIKAFDLDDPQGPNGQLIYSLPLELNSLEINNTFSIDESTGILGLKRELDFEKRKNYFLKIKVQDKGSNPVPIYTDVTVNVLDLNDNPPEGHMDFGGEIVSRENKSNNTIWIQEEIFKGQVINLGYLTLNDLDSPEVNGFNLSAELTNIFYLNASSLEINEEKNPTFKLTPLIQEYNNIYYSLQLIGKVDREEKLYFDLKIKLSDASKATYFNLRIILIDINDNAPLFQETISNGNIRFYKFYVPENQLRLNFAHINCLDLDEGINSQLEFRILDENNPEFVKSADSLNPNYLFYINSDNGSLSLRGELDREQREFYLFTIRVCDKPGLCAEILVEIAILDENDNQPVFAQNVAQFILDENKPANFIIGNIKAQDPDLNPRTSYTIEPSEFNRYFLIDQENGNLMTRISLDAEDPSLSAVLVNNSFNFRVLVKDAVLQTRNLDSMSKMNVSIYLNDLNDNLPEVLSLEKIILLDLSKNLSLLKIFNCQDKDRELRNRNNSLFKINFIRRLSWQFVNEIVKNQVDSNETRFFLDWVLRNEIKPLAKLNLRSVFSLENKIKLNQAELILTQGAKLNWGVYNFSILIQDSSNFKTEFSIKLFVFNSLNNNSLGFNLSQMEVLGDLVESWWDKNYNLIKKRKNSDDNGDDLDGIGQEFYRLYSSARFNLNRNNSLVNLANMFLFNKASNSILVVISAFCVLAILLIGFISYKQFQASGNKEKKYRKNRNTLINVNQLKKEDSSLDSTGSINISDYLNDKQSTKDLSTSPRSKFRSLSLKTSSNNNEQNANRQSNQSNNNSICDSFTVITSLAAGDSSSMTNQPTNARIQYNRNTITAISETSSESSINPISTNTTTVLISNTTSTPTIMLEQPTATYMSTFTSKQTDPSGNLLNDMGYYGSSDYSENNSFGLLSQKQVKPIQRATNQTSSFTSSSLLSSPSSSTDSSSAGSPTYANKPTITNLYPVNCYQKVDTAKSTDVKIYLERFERIYNSDSINNQTNSNGNKQRNNVTSYSYV